MADELSSGLVPLSDDNDRLREEYFSAVAYLNEHFPYQPSCKGKTNPYTLAVIRTKRDYDEYLRQHALRLTYEKLFTQSKYGNLFTEAKESFDKQVSELRAKNVRLAVANHSQMEEIDRLKKERQKTERKARRTVFVAVFLVAVLLIGAFKLLPDARSSSYESGKTEGYNAGIDKGYADGFSVGENKGFSNGYAAGVANEAAKQKKKQAAQSNQQSFSEFLEEWQASHPSQNAQARDSSQNYASSYPAEDTQSQTVYITATGKKYHRNGCQYLSDSKIAISLSNAKARGYSPCSRCF